MKNHLNTKLFIYSCVFTFLSALHLHGACAETVKIPSQKILATEGGRFVLGQISDFRSDQYLLDTKTGRLWKVVNRPIFDSSGKATGQNQDVLQEVVYTSILRVRDYLNPSLEIQAEERELQIKSDSSNPQKK